MIDCPLPNVIEDVYVAQTVTMFDFRTFTCPLNDNHSHFTNKPEGRHRAKEEK